MTDRPNIIVFFSDQQRWDCMAAHGNPDGLTPNLDRLAREGTLFSKAVTPQPVCGPARGCLQTGQYATTCGVYKNGLAPAPGAPRLAELFNEAGYDTAYMGKWHLAYDSGEAAVPERNRLGYKSWLAANSIESTSGPYSLRLWDDADNEVKLPGYRSDALVDAGIRYIGERSPEDDPYMLWLSFIEPHHQNSHDNHPAPTGMEHTFNKAWLPPDLQALGGTSARDWAGYCAMIKRLDDGLGRLLDTLESTGQRENTIVVFISDHGSHFKTRGDEYKRTPHESSIRVPMVLSGAQWQGGGQHNCSASLIDIAPTLLASAGIDIPEAMDGRSLEGVLRGQAKALGDTAFIEFGCWGHSPGRAIRTNRWKYSVKSEDEYRGEASAAVYHEQCLYDLSVDPYELNNLVASEAHTTVREQLCGELLAHLHQRGEMATISPHPQIKKIGQLQVEYPE